MICSIRRPDMAPTPSVLVSRLELGPHRTLHGTAGPRPVTLLVVRGRQPGLPLRLAALFTLGARGAVLILGSRCLTRLVVGIVVGVKLICSVVPSVLGE